MANRITISTGNGTKFAALEDPFSIDGRYYLRDRNGEEFREILSPDGSVATPFPSPGPELTKRLYLGRGGFGAVVRVIDRIGIPRAVKFIEAADSSDPLLTGSLESEVRYANVRPFKHVSPILDYGQATDAENDLYNYYVSSYFDGPNLWEFFAERVTAPDAARAIREKREVRDQLHDLFLSLVDDLLSALVELQEASVVHMDIKPQNMIVLSAVSAPAGVPAIERPRERLFVIDLGAAKSIAPDRRGPTKLICTKYFFPMEMLQAQLGGLTQTKDGRTYYTIAYERLREHWRKIDLYSVGRTLENIVLDRARRSTPRFVAPTEDFRTAEADREALWRLVLGDDFHVIEGWIDSLLAAPNDPDASPGRARLQFQAVPQKASQGILASELLNDQYRGRGTRLSAAYVRTAPQLDPIIDHPTFRRLGRLHQLGLIDEILPDGTHTRYSHSLQTFDLTKRFVLGLNRNTRFRLDFARRDVDQLLLAALLHDIGQYQFSHSIEDLRKLGTSGTDATLLSITHDQEQALKYLKRRPSASEPSIAEIIDGYGYDLDEIGYMFQKSPKDHALRPALNLGRDLISGVVDADRVSYLQHDSLHTGVPYGRAIDVGSLVDALCVCTDRAVMDGEKVGLGIEEEGLGVVEAILWAVYEMYRNVYWRPENRAFMAAVKYVIRRLLANGMKFDEYLEAIYNKTDWAALEFLEHRFGENFAGEFNPLSSLAGLRQLRFQRVFELGYREGAEAAQYERIVRGLTPAREDLVIRSIADVLPGGAHPMPGEILFDVPLKRRLRLPLDGSRGEDMDSVAESGARPRLWVCRRDSATGQILGWDNLHHRSELAKTLGRIEDHSGRMIRVFFSRGLVDRLQAPLVERLNADIARAISTNTNKW